MSTQLKSALYDIEIISAPSILGLKPTGVEKLSERLLASGLKEGIRSRYPVRHVQTCNELYAHARDHETNCLNAGQIREFSQLLSTVISDTENRRRLALVLGGDCSILLGIMLGLKTTGTYGLIFLDAHADFYEPEKSTTGEVADMDLAIVTGRGPEFLSDINGQHPYVRDENIIHVGQRDGDETKKYGSRDIRETSIKCFDFQEIDHMGIERTTIEVLQHAVRMDVNGIWIHFDTDVLSDELNPAVDYRLPGGLQFEQVEHLIKRLLLTGRIAGMSVTIFNPDLDATGSIARNISQCLSRAFSNE